MVLFKSSATPPRPPKSHSHHTFSESLMEESIETAQDIISKWTALEQPHSSSYSSSYCSLLSLFSTGGDRGEAKRYIKAVSSLQSAMRRLITVHPGSEKLIRAQILMQAAMKHLQKEFYRILKSNRRYLHPESASRGSLSSKPTTSKRRSVKDSESDEESLYGSDRFNESRTGTDADAEAMADLKMIADCMISAGYGKECATVYKEMRRSIVDEELVYSGIESLSFSQIQKMEWEVVEAKIKRWLRGVKFAVRTLFNAERILCEYVFSSSAAITRSCFADITLNTALTLFGFPENVAKCKTSPEKIFRALDMYEAISDLWQEIDSVFSYESTAAVRLQAFKSLAKLAEAVRSMMAEFESSMSKEPSKSPFPGGGVHPLARYAMNFIASLADYSDSLAEVFTDWPSSTPSPLPEAYFGNEDVNNNLYTSPVSKKLAWLILILLCKVDRKAQLYHDVALSYLCLANNLQYVVAKVRNSNLRLLLGDDWVARHEERVKGYAERYERLAWRQALTSLPENPTAEITLEEAEERLRKFNLAFEEAYNKQSTWIVPDPKLRDDIKLSVTRKLVPVYQEFYRRYRVELLAKQRDEVIVRFAPEDLGKYLSDLFFGSSSSGSVLSYTSDSSRS